MTRAGEHCAAPPANHRTLVTASTAANDGAFTGQDRALFVVAASIWGSSFLFINSDSARESTTSASGS